MAYERQEYTYQNQRLLPTFKQTQESRQPLLSVLLNEAQRRHQHLSQVGTNTQVCLVL